MNVVGASEAGGTGTLAVLVLVAPTHPATLSLLILRWWGHSSSGLTLRLVTACTWSGGWKVQSHICAPASAVDSVLRLVLLLLMSLLHAHGALGAGCHVFSGSSHFCLIFRCSVTCQLRSYTLFPHLCEIRTHICLHISRKLQKSMLETLIVLGKNFKHLVFKKIHFLLCSVRSFSFFIFECNTF